MDSSKSPEHDASVESSQGKSAPQLVYKVVETSAVHDLALEEILNTWVRQGWRFESIQFVVSPASRRPTLAFILFTRLEEAPVEG